MKQIKKILVLFASVAIASMAQERELPLTDLPFDIKNEIIKQLTNSDSYDTAVQSIKNFRITNKSLNQHINSERVIQFIIDKLAQRAMYENKNEIKNISFDYYKIIAAVSLNTSGAREWLKKEIIKPHMQSAAKQVLHDLLTSSKTGDRAKVKILKNFMQLPAISEE